ncbi:MAG TPA: DinB family protein [Gemmatimonadales bacterium]|nr:DinB family protein [Gemmatimonadales bacterium]
MTTATPTKTRLAPGLHGSVLSRILEEGYGAGAWHGPDLESAVADVTPAQAFRRPGPGRHNIAEIALHHAFYARSVVERLTGQAPKPFIVEGEDWFDLEAKTGPAWPKVRDTLATWQRTLVKVVADLGAGRIESPLSEAERFDLVLGITCHAVYHAGQMQLVKKLITG